MVIALLRLFPGREQHRQVLGILRSVLGPTQAQPQCLGCQLYEEDNCEEAILYLEHWASELDLQRHIRSDLYRRVLEALELSRTSPEVHFHYVSETKGMEWIAALRGAAQPELDSKTIL